MRNFIGITIIGLLFLTINIQAKGADSKKTNISFVDRISKLKKSIKSKARNIKIKNKKRRKKRKKAFKKSEILKMKKAIKKR
jgi:hypothetical protein